MSPTARFCFWKSPRQSVIANNVATKAILRQSVIANNVKQSNTRLLPSSPRLRRTGRYARNDAPRHFIELESHDESSSRRGDKVKHELFKKGIGACRGAFLLKVCFEYGIHHSAQLVRRH